MMSSNLGLIYSEFNFNVLSGCENTTYIFENYRLNVSRKMLYRGGEEISVPPKAVETLAALLKKPGEIVSKDELINAIWTDTIVEESNLAHYLHLLRKIFGNREDGKPYIETLRRRGYRFNPVGEVSTEFEEISAAFNQQNNFSEPIAEKSSASSVDSRSFHSPENSIPQTEKRRNIRFMAAAFIATLLFGTLVFVYYQKLSVAGKSSSKQATEISVINLTDNSSIFSATISRDSKYFTYFEFEDKKYHLYLQQTGQPARLEVIPPTENLISGSTFSPDGEFIYFVSAQNNASNGTLYRVPTLGGTMTKVLEGTTSPVSFSPNGAEMVFARLLEKTGEHALVIASADGKSERILLTLDGSLKALANGGAWSPDGKTIAFGEIDLESTAGNARYFIKGIDIETGVTRELSRERWENCFRMDWMPDGEGLVFVGTRAGEGLSIYRDQVYYLSVASGESRRVTSDGSRYDSLTVTTTKDNSLIAVPVNRLSQIYKLETADAANSSLRLTNGKSDGRGGIAPLPDGRLGFISRTGENIGIWTMKSDGSDRRQVFDEFPFLEELRSTPDGKYFIFAAPRNGLSHLYRINSAGGNLKQITSGENNSEVDSSISPDSNWVYYMSNIFDGKSWKKQLRKTAIDGSQMIAIADIKADAPHISPDGKFVSLIENEKISVYSLENMKLFKTFETVKPNSLNNGAVWTPDGKTLVYPVSDSRGVINLWQQPLSGDAPRPLTKFTSGAISLYAFANDGSNLYISRGEQIRNAVLIKNIK